MTNFEFIQRWFREVWEEGNMDAAMEMLSDTFAVAGLTGDHRYPREEFVELFKIYRALTGRPRFSFTHHFSQDNWISVRFIMEADGPNGNTPLKVSGLLITRIEGQRMVENYTEFNYLELFRQLDQLPADSLAALMTGQKLTWM